jgi:hypothetical protein
VQQEQQQWISVCRESGRGRGEKDARVLTICGTTTTGSYPGEKELLVREMRQVLPWQPPLSRMRTALRRNQRTTTTGENTKVCGSCCCAQFLLGRYKNPQAPKRLYIPPADLCQYYAIIWPPQPRRRFCL